MADGDIIIVDDELTELVNAYSLLGEFGMQSYSGFMRLLDETVTSAVHSGATADNLRLFILQAHRIETEFATCFTSLSLLIDDYKAAIKGADISL
jgi:hypothetical protein